MKILFFGDSITDAGRERSTPAAGRTAETYSIIPKAYGSGFVFLTAAQLFYEKPNFYQILNRGIGGDRLPQLYARIQLDVWNEKPDVLSILVGVNDVERKDNPNYTDIERWGRVYRMMIRDTQEKCPNTKIIICEPFDLRAKVKVQDDESFNNIRLYSREAKKIAEEFNLPFVALQEKIYQAADIYGVENCCFDTLHPNLIGSKIISNEWLKVFTQEIIKE